MVWYVILWFCRTSFVSTIFNFHSSLRPVLKQPGSKIYMSCDCFKALVRLVCDTARKLTEIKQ